MNPATILTAGTLLFLALFMLGAITADLRPTQPFWPTPDARADLGLGLVALACAFCAGLQL